MRRLPALEFLMTVTACCGGTHDAGETAVTRSRVNAHVTDTPPVARAAPSAPRDGTPTLVTVVGNHAAPAPSEALDVSASASAPFAPPSGGYVVRSTAVHPESREAAPATTTYATADAPPPPPPVTRRPSPSYSGDGAVAMRRAPSSSSSGDGYGSAGLGASGSGWGGGSAGEDVNLATGSMTATVPALAGSARGAPSHGHGHAGAGHMSGARAEPVSVAASAEMVAPEPSPVAPTPTTHVTISVSSTVAPVPPPVADTQYQAPVGILTAASVGDMDRRANYLDYLARHEQDASDLGLDMSRRVRFRVVDAQGRGINDAHVTISGTGAQVSAQTHADGSWDFFPSIMAAQFAGTIVARADVENVSTQATVNIPSMGDAQGPVVLQIPAIVAPAPAALDLGFVIDVTGSMGDELQYVHQEIGSIVQRIKAESPETRVRVSATFYRDRCDSVVVQQIPFTTNIPGFANMMAPVVASGGGDYPEDMNAGLEAAMTRLSWSDGPAVRVMVLIADAPPQHYADEQYTYRSTMLDASRRGIRILPVAASGSDRSVEYLFRAMGAFTSTPYVYLTDDSGVGSHHMEADTDRVAVERFNDMLTRLVISDLHGDGMHEPGPLGQEGS